MAVADRATDSTPARDGDMSFCILHGPPTGPIEAQWRACLARSDFPTHYVAPEYFFEPSFRHKRPFAVLSLNDREVTAVLTGLKDGVHVQSGLSVRPQIVLSRHADLQCAMKNLVAGLLRQTEDAKVVDLFVWSEMEALVEPRFRRRRCEGVVVLDLSRGPEALFRTFSENKRTNIKKAIKYGVSVAPATRDDEISAYYAIYLDWSKRKNLPITAEAEFRETFALKSNRLLFLARYDGKVIAGVVIRFFPHGVMEYAANSSLESALRLRPNDLLHWRAIEWGCREGMSKYSLGGAHLFLRKFGGRVIPTTRHRLDLSTLQKYTIRDWLAEQREGVLSLMPGQVQNFGRAFQSRLNRFRANSGDHLQ